MGDMMDDGPAGAMFPSTVLTAFRLQHNGKLMRGPRRIELGCNCANGTISADIGPTSEDGHL